MKCFLIAKKLSHSFSKPIHNALSDYSYEYKELLENELEDFLEERDFDGINVTIPYKTAVMEYLDEISPEAEKIGAVNTIVNKGGKLCGYNTDYYGFCYMIKEAESEISGKDVAVIGKGGAAKTIVCVCEDMGAKSISIITREDINSGNMARFYNAQIVVNATPVGMYPNTGESAVDITHFKKCEALLDVIYNPAKTKLILDAEKMGIKAVNGLGMLVAQAKSACELFTDTKVPDIKIEEIKRKIEKQTKNIILIGMPGCGKSSVGKELARLLERPFYDSDDEIAKKGALPKELIERFGEAHFRKIESDVLSELCKKSGCVIATGGGAITVMENYDIMHQNGTVLYIDRPLGRLDTKDRPLSAGGTEALKALYEKRAPLYKKFAHTEVKSLETYQKTAQQAIKILE